MAPEAATTRMIEQETTVNRRYRVDRLVGEGGMAVVFRGHDLLLGRDVAIKALRPQFAADRNIRVRFEREAQAAAGFSHPNIIDIYDVGEEDGTPYIVMEFVRGQTLKEIIRAEGPFHPDDVAALLEQVCAALDYAHERGYVHRDVKPQNILVDGQGLARVVDFGIAKGLADSDLTEAGIGLGTVHYLSPEQAGGLMATPASDIYSTGVVAFEMLTRRLPFEADSAVGVAMRHVHDPPPRPSRMMPGVPAAVDAIVSRALDKDPTRRYPSAGAFARAMADWRHAAGGTTAAAADRPAQTTLALPTTPAPRPPGGERSDPRPAAATTGPARPRTTFGASTRERADHPRPVAAPVAAPRNDVGCATWVVGTVILIGLLALIWLGFRLTPRLTDLGRVEAPQSTEPAGAEVPAEDPTAAPAAGPPPTAEATEPAPAPAMIPAPDLIGMTLAEAKDALASHGLVLAQSDPVFSEAVPVDAVAEQDPPPNAGMSQGGTVYVKLSRGSAHVDLGSLGLVGGDPSAAEAALRKLGLAVQQTEVPDPGVPAGRVAGFDPATAEVGDTVTLQVSAGNLVRIPGQIQGEPVDQVARQLGDLGLSVGERLPVDRKTIEDAGIDLAQAEIEDGDVVGVQGPKVDFDALVPPGTVVDLVYYDHSLDRQS